MPGVSNNNSSSSNNSNNNSSNVSTLDGHRVYWVADFPSHRVRRHQSSESVNLEVLRYRYRTVLFIGGGGGAHCSGRWDMHRRHSPSPYWYRVPLVCLAPAQAWRCRGYTQCRTSYESANPERPAGIIHGPTHVRGACSSSLGEDSDADQPPMPCCPRAGVVYLTW